MIEEYAVDTISKYCNLCENQANCNCYGCFFTIRYGIDKKVTPIISPFPSKFKSIIKEEKEMIITIIGSYSKSSSMKECKDYWKKFGHVVNCPCDDGRDKLPLIEKQSTWIDKIKESDLIVAIPKEIKTQYGGPTVFSYEFGESTSYEMVKRRIYYGNCFFIIYYFRNLYRSSKTL